MLCLLLRGLLRGLGRRGTVRAVRTIALCARMQTIRICFRVYSELPCHQGWGAPKEREERERCKILISMKAHRSEIPDNFSQGCLSSP
jgi:hypothetical protein